RWPSSGPSRRCLIRCLRRISSTALAKNGQGPLRCGPCDNLFCPVGLYRTLSEVNLLCVNHNSVTAQEGHRVPYALSADRHQLMHREGRRRSKTVTKNQHLKHTLISELELP